MGEEGQRGKDRNSVPSVSSAQGEGIFLQVQTSLKYLGHVQRFFSTQPFVPPCAVTPFQSWGLHGALSWLCWTDIPSCCSAQREPRLGCIVPFKRPVTWFGVTLDVRVYFLLSKLPSFSSVIMLITRTFLIHSLPSSPSQWGHFYLAF